MNKAIFLDRDGVINPLVYHTEAGVLDSPFTPAQLSLIPGVPPALARLRQLGYQLILISNQPGLAKGHFNEKTFNAIREKMNRELGAGGLAPSTQHPGELGTGELGASGLVASPQPPASSIQHPPLDAEYYCLHHPQSTSTKYRVNCNCRKPKPGLLLQAAADHRIDLAQSWFIGDSLTDVQAGRAAGVRTILIGAMKCELCRLMDETGARPHHIIPSLSDAVDIIQKGLVQSTPMCEAHK